MNEYKFAIAKVDDDKRIYFVFPGRYDNYKEAYLSLISLDTGTEGEMVVIPAVLENTNFEFGEGLPYLGKKWTELTFVSRAEKTSIPLAADQLGKGKTND